VSLADTAKLVASLELQDKFSRPLSGANRSLDSFQRNLGQTGRGIGQLGAGVGRVAVNLLKIGVAGGIAVGAFVGSQLRAGVASLRALELATAQTEAVLKSTGGVAGETVADIRRLAEQYESLNATMDDKVIQSGENLLLTFTNIRKEAFEPTLKAALDMNQAMGGGEQGLQDTIIRLGKALQDPVKGFTALRRVGVNITADQQKQIKALIAQNDLYGAQQIILKELATEFGGSFARAGDTAAGRTAKLHDNIEDLQRTFAGPFASVLDRITRKLGDFLGETGTVRTVERVGAAIAGLFSDEAIDRGIGVLRNGLDLLSPSNLNKIGSAATKAFEAVKGIDFDTIGKGLEITARVAKTAIDAFLALPKEVQGIAIAALAANKLSGGLIGSGLGNIAKGLGGLVLGGGLLGRGSSAANPVWVQSATGGVGGGVGGRGSPLPLLGAGAVAVAGTLFSQGSNVNADTAAQMAAFAAHKPGATLESVLTAAGTLGGLTAFAKDQALRAGVDAHLLAAIDKMAGQLDPTLLAAPVVSEFKRSRATSEQLLSLQAASRSDARGMLDNLRSSSGYLSRIATKNFSPTINLTVQNNLNSSMIGASLYQIRTAARLDRLGVGL